MSYERNHSAESEVFCEMQRLWPNTFVDCEVAESDKETALCAVFELDGVKNRFVIPFGQKKLHQVIADLHELVGQWVHEWRSGARARQEKAFWSTLSEFPMVGA